MSDITPTITDEQLDEEWFEVHALKINNVAKARLFARAVLALAESKQAAKVAELEARIDALMLEHCPDEMTPEQVAEWAKHQQPAEEAAQVKCIDYKATVESLRARIAALEAQIDEYKSLTRQLDVALNGEDGAA